MTAFHDPVDDVLRAIGSIDDAPGSGSAVALVLSVAVECVRLHARLSLRSRTGTAHEQPLVDLLDRLDELHRALRAAFDEDARRVGEMVAARRRRDVGTAEDRARAVEEEVRALEAANRVLVELLEAADELERHAGYLLDGPGVGQAASESATAAALTGAARTSLEAMRAANAGALARRAAARGVEPAQARAMPAAGTSPSPSASRDPRDGPLSRTALAEALEAWDDTGVRGLCTEGRMDVVLDTLRARGVRIS